MNEYIQFKKQRELGAILTDTFAFIRTRGLQLLGLILRITGPALLVLVFSYVYYIQVFLGQGGGYGGVSGNFIGSVFIALLLMIVSGMAFYALLYGTILHSIKSYIENNGEIIKEEVTSGVKNSFWSLLGLSILVALMTGVGMIFCIAPGIYLAVVLALTYSIHVFEKKDVTESISYSFRLIKDEWWITFATFIVIGILYYIMMIVFNIPQYIYLFIRGFTIADTISANPADMFDWVYLALNSIGIIAQYILQGVIVIATAFIYYNLNEKKNFTGTIETIETLGEREKF